MSKDVEIRRSTWFLASGVVCHCARELTQKQAQDLAAKAAAAKAAVEEAQAHGRVELWGAGYLDYLRLDPLDF